MSPTVFGFGGGIFFVSYFLFEVPSNLLLEKVGARLWIARIMITWGFLAAGTAFVVGPTSFYTMRLLLGAAEAGFFPGVILYITYWFPSEYRARIVGMFTVAIPVSSFLGSPISAALLGVDGWLGLRGWQWMFIMEGAPAVLLGSVLPVHPERQAVRARPGSIPIKKLGSMAGCNRKVGTKQARRANQPVARAVEQARFDIERDAGGKHGRQQRPANLAAADHQVVRPHQYADWACSIPSRSRLASVIMVLWGKRSDQTGERVWHTALPLVVTAVSLASALVFNSLPAIIIILCLAVIGIYAGKGPVWALSAEWLSAGTAAAGLAQMNAISNLAGFGTTYVVGSIKQATGSYPLAILPLACLSAAGALCGPADCTRPIGGRSGRTQADRAEQISSTDFSLWGPMISADRFRGKSILADAASRPISEPHS